METAQNVLEECRKHELPLFLEIVTYNNRGLKHQQILSGISLFLDQGLRPDVFKLEYPGSEEYCKKITNILGATPWILLTRGEDFTMFEEHLAVAVSQGAQGFLAGRSLWQEVGILRGEEKEKFLKETLVDRFKRICQIATA